MKIHHLVHVEYTLFCKMAQFWNKQIISVNIYIVDSANNAKSKAQKINLQPLKKTIHCLGLESVINN